MRTHPAPVRIVLLGCGSRDEAVALGAAGETTEAAVAHAQGAALAPVGVAAGAAEVERPAVARGDEQLGR